VGGDRVRLRGKAIYKAKPSEAPKRKAKTGDLVEVEEMGKIVLEMIQARRGCGAENFNLQGGGKKIAGEGGTS